MLCSIESCGPVLRTCGADEPECDVLQQRITHYWRVLIFAPGVHSR